MLKCTYSNINISICLGSCSTSVIDELHEPLSLSHSSFFPLGSISGVSPAHVSFSFSEPKSLVNVSLESSAFTPRS